MKKQVVVHKNEVALIVKDIAKDIAVDLEDEDEDIQDSSNKVSGGSSKSSSNGLNILASSYLERDFLTFFKDRVKGDLSTGFLEDILSSLNNFDMDNIDLAECQEVYEKIEKCIKELKKVNVKGFVNETDLMKYPLIGEVIPYLIRNRESVFGGFKKDVLIGDKKFSFLTCKDLYKWSYNLINLKMYMISETIIKGLQKDLQSELSIDRNLDDLFLDYVNLGKSLLNNLDPSLRKLFNKRGISITQNVYTGFDTEYVNLNAYENRLLSVQLAVSDKTLLKLPLNRKFDFVDLNVDTNKYYKSNEFDEVGWTIDGSAIKCIIDNSVDYVRGLKYSNYDNVFDTLIKGLRSRGIKEVVKDDNVYFIFDEGFNRIKEWYKETSKISLSELVNVSKNLSKDSLEINLANIYELLKGIYDSSSTDLELEHGKELRDDLEVYKESLESLKRVEFELDTESLTEVDAGKKFVRSYNQSISQERINITKKVNNYFIGHLTSADLSMLSDFEDFKHSLDIVNKSFVTLSRPILMGGMNIIIRDTMLLAPGGKKSLDAIGKMYNMGKVVIPEFYKDKMDVLLKKDPVLFKEYAMQDAVIALVHAGFMEVFFNQIGGIGVPLTLSGLSSNYIKHFWSRVDYRGYQVSYEYLLTNVGKSNTPKGFSVLKDVGLMNNNFIASYRGGRNESFMFGKEISDCIWYDYDLVSAYTTAMAGLGTPDYGRARVLDKEDFNKLGWKDLVYSYTVMKVKFKFPESVKYPSIPCNIDESTTVYPLEGSSIISSLEYIVAEKQGCYLEVSEIIHIPFKKDGKGVEKPFRDCIEELQKLRSKYDKGSINNLLYKEIGNSLYGLTVRGIGNKLKFDIRSGGMKRMEGNELSNPIIASWITSFVRSTVSECLHSIQELGGRVVSVTTDGFITDISNLESRVVNMKGRGKSLLGEYKDLRNDLLNDNTSLEVKKSGKGIVSWCTRGQISSGSGIVAMTGYQRGNLGVLEVEGYIIKIMDSEDKSFNFLKTQLRSAKDIFMKGGQVTQVYSDQIYRVMFDNKRVIIEHEGRDLLDSRPLNKVEEGMLLRYISKVPKSLVYSRNIQSVSSRYKNKDELVIRNFLKALLNNELNLKSDSFKSYREIVEYIKEFKSDYSISENYISQLKRRGNFVRVPRTDFGILFVDYVCIRFPDFKGSELFIK